MKNQQEPLFRSICKQHIDNGCRSVCPLAKPCDHKHGDTFEIFAERMNKASEILIAEKNNENH